MRYVERSSNRLLQELAISIRSSKLVKTKKATMRTKLKRRKNDMQMLDPIPNFQ